MHQRRRQAVSTHKRALIIAAARAAFEEDGLEGASLRSIAARAGYTPAALYFHFSSREALYAEVLAMSLAGLAAAVDAALADETEPETRLRAAAMAFYDFYAAHPRDLDLGFYLFRGGMRPHGLGREHDAPLNAALMAALAPIGEAAEALGIAAPAAMRLMADLFAHAVGLLLLEHTRRIGLFGVAGRDLMQEAVALRLAALGKGGRG